ncbi:hypothetical protein [Neolewinella persica]|uniref:hypothetical protein n=1 Tax=Neolewinella persica TaxID=70998 RepID=UPI000375D2D2|nr:hypothetical protein [Neolewinella persica]
MLKNATTLTVIGFLLMFVGIVTFFLNVVGVDFILLEWLYRWNVAVSFVVRILMIIVGMVLIYVGQTDWDREEA